MTDDDAITITTSPEYLDVTATAKLIRKALREAFPGERFSVRSSRYAGGSSVHIDWTDGPTTGAVDAVIGFFAGGRFDGMIDMAYYATSWLTPDGHAALAHDPGTGGQRGSNPERIGDAPSPDARLVHFGADHVMTNRKVSPAFRAELEAVLIERWGSLERAAEQNHEFGTDGLMWREASAWDYRAGVMLPAPETGRYVQRHAWLCRRTSDGAPGCVLEAFHDGDHVLGELAGQDEDA